jgi:hypothetical protein
MLVNETDRVLCFAHSAFHATLVGGASVRVQTEALAELIHGEIQRIERGGAKTGFKLVAV